MGADAASRTGDPAPVRHIREVLAGIRRAHGRPPEHKEALLGADVAASGGKEIGFAPLLLTDEGQRSPLQSLQGIPVLHWHGEAFELPAGARRLASTPACRHQAFAMGSHALALQCHPELDARQFERWLIGHTLELAQAGIDPNDLRAQARRYGAPLAAAATAMFDHWLQELPETPQ